MFDDYNICPYTGLRSFTEEESIYFKGRDEHIQEATKQLEQNKFLMVTGASGDGKSSIVYAGIIPNARAGFLKATYPNWQIADFRPERSPFKNLCSSISEAIGINNEATVASELQHGFSALIDLYKSSPLYIDAKDQSARSEDEQREEYKKSANLLILVDQFEEFFTNPENYSNGKPSNDATLTLNLLLETAKIALSDNVPIYIVFTMRSDFIGQCAAFRELPEYIGFSQFFVPRLNRRLLQEVIEEPCELSGNKISRRLTERIIHDMRDGVDQLPILQHALNQIWKAADDGKEEMDLIHYAMVGGLNPMDLPDEHRVKFETWFNGLPKNIQACFNERSLHNVLDTHANKLYQGTVAYLHEKHQINISSSTAHEVLKVVFTSLTKIDQSREVRNRMTLQEIVDILDLPEVDVKVMAAVIDQFREPGNTFVRPFIVENEENQPLLPESVLDITHESLIRNWELLRTWAREEYDKFNVFKDFKQQVDRWLEHSRSGGFLLPIGSLTFFENWYSEARINKSWVNRYNEQVTDTPKDLDESNRIVTDSKEFLRRSNRKHVATRAIIRFGPKRIAAVIAILVTLGLSSFLYYDYNKRTNSFVLNQIMHESLELLNDDRPPYDVKAENLITRDRIESGQFFSILNDLESEYNKFNIAITAAEDLVHTDRLGNTKLKREVLLHAGKLALEMYPEIPSSQSEINNALNELTNLSETFEYYNYFYEDNETIEAGLATMSVLKQLILAITENPFEQLNAQFYIEGVEMLLNHKVLTISEIELIIQSLTDQNNIFGKVYSKDKVMLLIASTESLPYNGKYQLLGELYASIGDLENALKSVDKILEDRPRYEIFATDGLTIGAYLALYNHWDVLDQYTLEYGERIGHEPYEIYRQISSSAGVVTQSIAWRKQYNRIPRVNRWYNPVKEYLPEEQVLRLYLQYKSSIIRNEKTTDAKAFNLALHAKQKGLYLSKRYSDKQIDKQVWIDKINEDYSQFITWYNQISETYLAEEVNTFFHTPVTRTRREILTYPDFIEFIPSHLNRTRYVNYLSQTFLTYLIDNNLALSIYPGAPEARQITTWIQEYKTAINQIAFDFEGTEMSLLDLQKIDSLLSNNTEQDRINANLLLLLLAESCLQKNNNNLAISYVERIDPVSLPDLFREEWNDPHTKTMMMIGKIMVDMVINNRSDLHAEIYKSFGNIRSQYGLMHYTARRLFINNLDSLGTVYLDSASKIYDAHKEEIFPFIRSRFAYSLALAPKTNSFQESREIIRNLGGFIRVEAYENTCRATVFRNNLFNAYNGIPKFPSAEERLVTINQMLLGMVTFNENEEWKVYNKNYLFPREGISYWN